MREALFIDTSFVIALLNRSDRHHGIAKRWARVIANQATPRILSTAILLELGDGFHEPAAWARVRPVIESYRNDPSVTVVDADAECVAQALALKNARSDKEWGLTDCTSFVIMDHHGVRSALTADQHFVQAGFRALLLE